MSTTFWIQFLGVMFGAGMLYFTYVRYKKKELNRFELFIWQTGWLILAGLAFFPFILDPIIHPLNFHRRLDFFVVFGFFTLLGIAFYNYIAVKRMEKKVEVFVRKEAIKKHESYESKKETINLTTNDNK